MKRIPLTKNQLALVDTEDFEQLNQWKWYSRWNEDTESFYAVRRICEKGKGYSIQMSREILGLKRGDKLKADHINHDTLNNCKSNLRVVTNQQNNFNQRNTKGYTRREVNGKYQARIMLNGRSICLGEFRTPEEAHNAYLQAKLRYHRIDIVGGLSILRSRL